MVTGSSRHLRSGDLGFDGCKAGTSTPVAGEALCGEARCSDKEDRTGSDGRGETVSGGSRDRQVKSGHQREPPGAAADLLQSRPHRWCTELRRLVVVPWMDPRGWCPGGQH